MVPRPRLPAGPPRRSRRPSTPRPSRVATAEHLPPRPRPGPGWVGAKITSSPSWTPTVAQSGSWSAGASRSSNAAASCRRASSWGSGGMPPRRTRPARSTSAGVSRCARTARVAVGHPSSISAAQASAHPAAYRAGSPLALCPHAAISARRPDVTRFVSCSVLSATGSRPFSEGAGSRARSVLPTPGGPAYGLDCQPSRRTARPANEAANETPRDGRGAAGRQGPTDAQPSVRAGSGGQVRRLGTGLAVLITQRSQVQILPPLPK